MPPQLGPCVGCGSTASKYKCPTCYEPTCSLNCSRSHRTQHDGSGSEGQSSKQGATPAATQRTKTNQYVPLKEYTENQFLHDYHFLSSIGRKVSSAGSQLLSQGLLPQQIEANLNALNRNRGPPSGPSQPGPSYRPDFEKVKHLKMRSALKDELRKRKCKVMWLPEGMGREKGNRTRWDERSKRVRFSMEVKLGEGSQTFHDLPSNLPVQIKVLEVLERESFKVAPPEWQAEHKAGGNGAAGPRGGKRARKRQRQDNEQEDGDDKKEEDGKTQHKPFYISDFVLASHGLLDANTTSPSKIPQAHAHLPANITIAVQIHNMRLRNESSLKYLEWWERRGKREEEEGGDGSEIEPDSTEGPMRAWGQQPQEQHVTMQVEKPPAPPHNPFIPASLLSSLSAQLDAFKGASGVQPVVSTDIGQADSIEEEEQPPAQHATTRRHVYLLPTTQASPSPPHVSFIGLEALLRSLPSNWAVVEYPTVEVWRKDELHRCKEVEVVRHQGSDADDEQVVSGGATAAPPVQTAPAQASSPPRPLVAAHTVPTKPFPSKLTPSLGLGLGAYDSDESDEDEDEQPTPPPAPAQSAPLKRIRTLAEQELLALRSGSASAAVSEDEKETAVGGGLADIARTLGLVPQQAEKETVVQPAAVKQPEEEQEVDWEE